jgi:hypothetical protein
MKLSLRCALFSFCCVHVCDHFVCMFSLVERMSLVTHYYMCTVIVLVVKSNVLLTLLQIVLCLNKWLCGTDTVDRCGWFRFTCFRNGGMVLLSVVFFVLFYLLLVSVMVVHCFKYGIFQIKQYFVHLLLFLKMLYFSISPVFIYLHFLAICIISIVSCIFPYACPVFWYVYVLRVSRRVFIVFTASIHSLNHVLKERPVWLHTTSDNLCIWVHIHQYCRIHCHCFVLTMRAIVWYW